MREKFSPSEIATMKALAYELKSKMEYAFVRPLDELLIAEIKAIRLSLENMGFCVTWQAALDNKTYKVTVDVTLWLKNSLVN